MQVSVDDLAHAVRKVDWSQYACASGSATMIPTLWDRFILEGDPEWEFGNELCHQGTLYTAIFPLASPLLDLAMSQHSSRVGALHILAAVLHTTGGTLANQRRLSEMFSGRGLFNPINPGKRLTPPPPPPRADVDLEAENIRQLRIRIESHLPRWLQMAGSTDAETRHAALELLAGITYHEDQELAEKAIRQAHEEGTEEDRRRLEWIIDKLDGVEGDDGSDEDEEDDLYGGTEREQARKAWPKR